MTHLYGWLSNIGRSLGNWNDRHSRHDCKADETLRYRVIDRLSHHLYVLGDRKKAA